ncbi:MAG: type II secretion system minor pseudopilin GspH [Gammaproteobacteria bacterium]|nr:type II secretion system minor pseudopilin GspH [Gammaproteobacteria bacterium]
MTNNCLSAAGVRRKQSGFTLIEVMVVVLIIGIIISFASLSVGQSASQEQEEEARRLTALLRLGGEEAIFNSRELVLEVFKGGYRFMEIDPKGQRQPVGKEETTYRARELPEQFHLRLEIDGTEVALTGAPQEGQQPPAVFMLSSGEMTPFVLDVVDEQKVGYRLQGEYSGMVNYVGKVEL